MPPDKNEDEDYIDMGITPEEYKKMIDRLMDTDSYTEDQMEDIMDAFLPDDYTDADVDKLMTSMYSYQPNASEFDDVVFVENPLEDPSTLDDLDKDIKLAHSRSDWAFMDDLLEQRLLMIG